MIKKKWIVFFGSIFFLPLVIFVSLFTLDRDGFFAVKNIEIEVPNKENIDAVYLDFLISKLRLDLNNYKGKSILRMDLNFLSHEVARNEWVKGQTIIRKWPGTLVFQIEAYSIPFIYISKSGQFFPVSELGQLLPQLDLKNAPDVTILSGELFSKKIDLRKKAVDAFYEIPENGSFSRKSIAEMKYDNKKGFWVKLIKSGLEVKLGEDQFSLKSSRVSQVIDYLEKNNLEAQVIDANLSKKVLVKLRKE